jgi:hypothetical protein
MALPIDEDSVFYHKLRHIQRIVTDVCPPLTRACVQTLQINMQRTTTQNMNVLQRIVSLACARTDRNLHLQACNIERTTQDTLCVAIEENKDLERLWQEVDGGLKRFELSNPITKEEERECLNWVEFFPYIELFDLNLDEETAGNILLQEFLRKMVTVFRCGSFEDAKTMGTVEPYRQLQRTSGLDAKGHLGLFTQEYMAIQTACFLPPKNYCKMPLRCQWQYFARSKQEEEEKEEEVD